MPDPFEYLKSAGLDVTVHEIGLNQVHSDYLYLTADQHQKAVLVKEDATTTNINTSCVEPSEILGLGVTDSPGHGTPIVFDADRHSEVRTKHIVNYIDSKCKNATTCKDDLDKAIVPGNECDFTDGQVTADELDALDYHLIKYTIAHEVGHQIMLTWKYTNKEHWHHKTPYDCLMQQNISVQSGDTVVFDTPIHFGEQCQLARRVWED